MNAILHPLELDASERSHFESTVNANVRAEYRRVVAKLTGGLPSWAERKRPGRKPKSVPTM
ncbi:hypothetical protein LBW56_16405 [Ralstonia solanacearum]|uniref:hypothetical protein n=1 Tax=Ralstonia solanacearum TaxID=305 RepID=UPI001FFB3223|nr:hypothetical protein [Ralstonia solanacearum]MDB0528270.1 hypothetical protein [Ralstonia solanacearum]